MRSRHPDRLFGLRDLGLGSPELGYISLAEITVLKGPLGLPVERDLYFIANKPISVYAEETSIKRLHRYLSHCSRRA